MTVQSKPMKDGKVDARGARNEAKAQRQEQAAQSPPRGMSALHWRAAGLGALALGGVLWLLGSRFTILGAPRLLEALLSLFGFTIELPTPSGWTLLILVVVLGVIISLIEFRCRPRREFFEDALLGGTMLLGLWLVFNAGDCASTFFGVTTPNEDAWAMTRWIAATPPIAVIWTGFLTYCPEILLYFGARWLVRGRF